MIWVIVFIVGVGLYAGIDAGLSGRLPDFGFILGGVFLFGLYQVIASFLHRRDYIEDADKIEEEITAAQMQRIQEKSRLLYAIGKPDKDGRYSPAKMVLWERFLHLDKLDKRATKQERERLIRARGGYIDE